MGSYRSYSYQPIYAAPKRPFKRSVQIFFIEWMPVLVTLVLATLIFGTALSLVS